MSLEQLGDLAPLQPTEPGFFGTCCTVLQPSAHLLSSFEDSVQSPREV